MIAITLKIFGGKFPIAWHVPFLYPAKYLGATWASISIIEGLVEIEYHVTHISVKGWGLRVPGGPDGTVVVDHLRHLDQPPLLDIQLASIAFAMWYAHQPSVGGKAPAMIGAGKQAGVAFIIIRFLICLK